MQTWVGGEASDRLTPTGLRRHHAFAMTHRAFPTSRASDDRMQDAVDFSRAAKLHRKIDRELLRELGGLVYAGGGDAILKLIEDARAGRRLDV